MPARYRSSPVSGVPIKACRGAGSCEARRLDQGADWWKVHGMQTIRLPAELDISRVAEMQADLKAGLGSDGECELDALNVSRVDTSGVQMILAFMRSAQARGVSVRLANPPEHLVLAIAKLGLTEVIPVGRQP